MRILAIGDPHGEIPQIKNIVKTEKPEIVICTGDFSGDEGIKKLIFKNWGAPWWSVIGKTKAREMIKKATQKGKKVLSYLNELGVPVYFIHGNNEHLDSYGTRVFKKKNINYMHGKKKKLGSCSFIFHGGYATPKIFFNPRTLGITEKEALKRKKEQEKEKKKIETLFSRSKGKTVFVTHCTPYLYFDKIKNRQSPMNGKHIGVEAYRELIKKHKPRLYICGHMHENQGVRKIGSTTAVCLGLSHKYVYLIDLNRKINIKQKRISKR